jgi:hypothetical protein
LRQFAIAREFTGKKANESAHLRTAHLLLNYSLMMDLIYVGATGAFFVIALTYVWGCIRL